MKLSLFLFLQRHLEQFWMNEQSHLLSEINQDNCCQPSAEHTALRALGPGPWWCQGWRWSSISGRLRRGCWGDKEKGAPPLKPSWRSYNPHTFTHLQGSLSYWSQGIGWLAPGPFQACPLMGTGIKPTEMGLPQSPLLLECFREWELSGSQVFWEVRKVRRSCNELVGENPDSKPLARALGSTLHFFELRIPHLENGLYSYLLVVRITWNNMLIKL